MFAKVRTVFGIAGRRFLERRAGGNQRGPRGRSRSVGGVTVSPTWYMRGGPQPAASGVVTQQSATVCSGQEAIRHRQGVVGLRTRNDRLEARALTGRRLYHPGG